jgi:uncharacterized membrane protein YciS (DUF1049 family)
MKYLSFDYVVYKFIAILFVCVIAFALGAATTQAVALVYFILALSLCL